jgi:hypothetical protein
MLQPEMDIVSVCTYVTYLRVLCQVYKETRVCSETLALSTIFHVVTFQNDIILTLTTVRSQISLDKVIIVNR